MNRNLWSVALIIGISFGVYFNTLKNEFVHDDEFIVENNSLIRSPSNLPKIFSSNYWAGTKYEKETLLYRPLVITSFAFDYKLWGKNPAGYHLTNIILNTINSVLVYFLTFFIFSGALKNNNLYVAAFISSLIFTVHPVHSEAVAGIVGRTELMATLFFLISLILYLRESGHKLLYWISLLFYFLGILSKEMAITLPAVIMIYDFVVFGKDVLKQRIKLYAGYFCTAFFYLILRTAVLGKVAGEEQLWMLAQDTFLVRFYNIVKILGFYVRLLFFPFGLRPEYEHFKVFSMKDPYVFISLIFFAVLIALAAKSKIKKNYIFPILWFFITILPVSNIIPMGGFIGERFLYLPSVGFCWLLGAYISEKNDILYYYSKLSFAVVLILLFSFLTIKRNHAWKDDYTLWTETLKVDRFHYKAFFNLGVIAREEKRYQEAEERLLNAITLHPDSLSAYYELGIVYFDQLLWDKARDTFIKSLDLIKYYEDKGLKLGEHKSVTLRYIALCYSNISDRSSAIEYYHKAIEATPRDASLYYECALQYEKSGRMGLAEKYILKTLEVNKDFVNAYIHLGLIYQSRNFFEKSAKNYIQAIKLDNTSFLAHYNLALVYENIDIKKAVVCWNKALMLGEKQGQNKDLLDKIRAQAKRLEKTKSKQK
ncbi:MAG: tetratricopeptide repeat protein [Endomicrobiales bacterium]|nr:tetratricopeptide repeat protein [Endomicrobiales bacterium]